MVYTHTLKKQIYVLLAKNDIYSNTRVKVQN